MTAVLSRQDIQRLLNKKPPLIEGCIDIEKQLQPNGVDITLRDIALPQSPGRLAVEDSQRLVSDLAQPVKD